MDTSLKSKSGYKTNVIVESLREQILSGVLRPGEKVMSARELGCHFQVSLVTANKALLAFGGRKSDCPQRAQRQFCQGEP